MGCLCLKLIRRGYSTDLVNFAFSKAHICWDRWRQHRHQHAGGHAPWKYFLKVRFSRSVNTKCVKSILKQVEPLMPDPSREVCSDCRTAATGSRGCVGRATLVSQRAGPRSPDAAFLTPLCRGHLKGETVFFP